ncbi:hypothetical protein L7F22_069086 [Adiantum nelumboides]|nr:hypothetical protein [Adiantum nelumboides]
MPSVPLLDSHGVDVDLLVEIVEEAMACTTIVSTLSGLNLSLYRDKLCERPKASSCSGLAGPDSLPGLHPMRGAKPDEFGYTRTKLWINDNELLILCALLVLPADFLRQKVLEALAHLSLGKRCSVFDSFCRRRETVDGRELKEVVGRFGGIELLPERGRLDLALVGHLEEQKPTEEKQTGEVRRASLDERLGSGTYRPSRREREPWSQICSKRLPIDLSPLSYGAVSLQASESAASGPWLLLVTAASLQKKENRTRVEANFERIITCHT